MASKKGIMVIGGVLAALGIAYASWRFTSMGKGWLNNWLMKKWRSLAQERYPKKPINWESVQQDLNSLDYKAHEVLFFLTRLDPMGKKTLNPQEEKKFRSHLAQLKKKGAFQKTGLNQLEGVIFPS